MLPAFASIPIRDRSKGSERHPLIVNPGMNNPYLDTEVKVCKSCLISSVAGIGGYLSLQ